MSLKGKLAIITGASRGIGAAIAENLAAKGCNVVLNYTANSSGNRTVQLAIDLDKRYPGTVSAVVRADMGSETGPAELIAGAKAHFHDPRTNDPFQIDIIINNAGVSVNNVIAECDAQDFAYQYNVNVRGPLLLVQAAEQYLPHDRSGRIVNISSVSSSLGFIGQSVYGGTKAALEAMTRTWARELAERCTVNAVNPGPVATDMYGGTTPEFQARMANFIRTAPLMVAREGVDSAEVLERAKGDGGRAAYASEIAGVVGMLCLPEAGFTTGSVVCANGGMKFSV
ncbi:NAD(P)-binding protein [Trichodelitschia bisporula]|uniref:NAD(P)-binding protein n=1 Tax=Trichodelitschia bisporula TaxID=703511 RepID=A0A6G1HTE0_9PEZI|nr:NAD(P)-binding protein [Trichodelitschia bisporula]